MDKNLRSRLYLLVLMIAIFVVWKYRQDKGLATVYVKGITMGVVQYNITYRDHEGRDFKPAIDSLLIDFNQSLSTYIPDSEISVFNRESVVEFELPYFPDVLKASADVYEKSGGAFDPTIGQLIDAWGFGSGSTIDPDSVQVDSLLELVGFDKIQFNNQRVITPIDGIALNFSAIAKGQAIDVVAEYLEMQGIENYLVEIGTEVRCLGKSPRELPWVVGIEKPDEVVVGQVYDRVFLENGALAGSGNYRNFRLSNGRKVAHTIDPRTGYPKMQTLLGATIWAPNCMLADAYATAAMVLGLEEARQMVLADPQLEAYFIFADEAGNLATYVSPGMEKKLAEPVKP